MNFDIKKLKNSKELALLLGMFAGDGCLSISHNGEGYRIYPIRFFNTNKNYVEIFDSLFYTVFNRRGTITGRKRANKKILWEFSLYSVEIYKLINVELEIANGKKALNVRIPSFIRLGNNDMKKHFFLGLLITDGGIRATGDIIFHSASKHLILDISKLIYSVWGFDRKISDYIQKEKFLSYQLTLNKTQSFTVLSTLPTWHNLVLRWS
jgi:intein/homing endonuclease